jgi:Serine dehydrogenase proteinase
MMLTQPPVRKTLPPSRWESSVAKKGEQHEPNGFRGSAEVRSRDLPLRRAGKGMPNNVQKKIFSERSQSPTTRISAVEEVEKYLGGRTLVTFFTSFDHPVDIDDDDCDMLQSVLQHIDLSAGLAIMINSPGGDGLAAERIVNTCRAYSGTGDYWAIVPGRAKSAATIICLGASKILMAASSELGPVDPQIFRREGDSWKQFSAYSLVSGYDKLFLSAVKSKGNLEPFIQQLQKYDVRDINKYRDLIKLSEDISVKILKSGIMKSASVATIKNKIKIFLDPSSGTISHGRSINREEAESCGLDIVPLDVHSPDWVAIYELYARTDFFVSGSANACKTVESREESFSVPVDR